MRRSLFALALCAGTLSAACADSPIAPSVAPSVAQVAVTAYFNLGDPTAGAFADVTGITMTVTGPGIAAPLVFDLGTPTASGRSQTFDLRLPTGSGLVLTTRAFTGTAVSHQAVDTVTVTSAGLALDLYLRRVTGAVGGGATLEDFALAVDDSTGFREVVTQLLVPRGASHAATAQVTYATAGGGHLAGDPVANATVSWAVENPGIATVSPTTCTTTATGTCGATVTVRNQAKSGDETGLVASYGGRAYRVVLRVP